MKIRSLISLGIIFLIGTLGLGACTTDESASEVDNTEVEEIVLEEEVQLSDSEQLELMASLSDSWYNESDDENFVYFAVTDLDGNERKELTVATENWEYSYISSFEMYEVSKNGKELDKIEPSYSDEGTVDISYTNTFDAYKGSDGAMYYVVSDYNMSSYEEFVQKNYLMKLKEGTLSFEYISEYTLNFLASVNNEKYFDAEGEVITQSVYEGIADKYFSDAEIEAENYYLISGFRMNDGSKEPLEMLQLASDECHLFTSEEYEEYYANLYSLDSSLGFSLGDMGTLYGTDINNAYLGNTVWSSFYVYNYELGTEINWVDDENPRFEYEMAEFYVDGTGYYVTSAGERKELTWYVNEYGNGVFYIEGDEYEYSIFGYTLSNEESNNIPVIAIEYENQYIYMMISSLNANNLD